MSNTTKAQESKRARFSRIFVVFGKEIRETFRDHRVIIGVIISPLLVTPLLMGAAGFFIGQKVSESKVEVLNVALVGGEGAKGLPEVLQTDKTLSVTSLATMAEAETRIKGRSQRAALIVPEGTQSKLDTNETVAMEILYDESNEKSRTAQGRLKDILKAYNEQILTQRLQSRGLSQSLLKPTEAKSRSLASDTAVGGIILSILLPYIIVLSGAVGGMTSAFDTCAGEKERGTMETLLVSPVSRTEIILGKVLTISLVSFISALCSITGLIVSFQSGLKYFEAFTKGKIAISYSAIGVMILMVIPLTMLTSALLLAISSFARNQKEAQAYVFPFMIVVILPAILSMVMGEESSLSLSLIPILNIGLVIKQVLINAANIKFIALALSSSLVYAGIALTLVVALFNREEILFRS